VSRLSRAERRRIKAYVNLDMVGSPGDAKAAVYVGEGADGRAIEAALREGLPEGAPEERLGGASDHASFAAFGVPVGGIFTGLDRCYHRACDRIGNVDADLAASAARATAGALVALAAG
jgi:aminopeptidase S